MINISLYKDTEKNHLKFRFIALKCFLSSMFPDFLEFDGTQHRTPRLNSAIALIYQNNSKLQGKKNGASLSFLDLSQEVIPLGFEPRTHTLKVYCSTS